MSNPRVHELLEKWKEFRDRGTPVSSEELCRDCPELIAEVRRKLDGQAAGEALDQVHRSPPENIPLQQYRIVENPDGQAEREEAEMVRARLRLAVCVFLVHWLVYGFLSLNVGIWPPSAAFEIVVLVGLVVLLGWRRGRWSRPLLRVLEFLLLFTVTQRNCIAQVTAYLEDLVPTVAHGDLLSLSADGIAAPWIEIIMVYGFIIPNSWRRSAGVVAGLVLMPLVILAGAAEYCEVLRHPVVVSTLEIAASRLLFAAAIAIIGSYGMQKLRREVRVAREMGQYALKRRLGQGGMAEVYLAEHRLLRRECAIKLIRPENSRDLQAQRRFAREVRAMSRIRHPHIVEIFDYGISAEGKFYYVMEYLSGVTLQELVNRPRPLAPARVVYLLRQILSALEAIHAQGIIHRDIKPSNLFLLSPDVVKIFDFGLVHLDPREGIESVDEDRLTRDNCIVGTPAYMAPEQIDLSRAIDPRSDLYAVGLVGYTLLVGRNPFSRDEVRKIFVAQVHEEAPPLADQVPGLPVDLARVIHRCLSKNPEDRYPSATTLREALEACSCARDWTSADAAAWWHGQTSFAVSDG